MEVNGHIIVEDTYDILIEIRRQLELNGIRRFAKIIHSGNNLQTNCPFHKEGQERKPSFGINKHTGECHCFGCDWNGTFTEMISNCFGYDDFGLYGTKWLIRNFLTISLEERQDVELDFERTRKNNVGRNISMVARGNNIHSNHNYISQEELDSYRYIHPYMYERKLTDEIIELFDIGYDKDTKCITFPVRDVNGNCLFIARRSVNSKFFNYPKEVEKPVYGLYELYNLKQFPKEIYICESMLDALTIWCYDKYAIALNGLGNELAFSQLQKFPCRKFILATDNDEAGKNARLKLRKRLCNKLITELDYSTYPIGAKDINDMNREEFYALKEVF